MCHFGAKLTLDSFLGCSIIINKPLICDSEFDSESRFKDSNQTNNITVYYGKYIWKKRNSILTQL